MTLDIEEWFPHAGDALNSGYSLSGFEIVRKPIPGFQVNTNEIKYEAFDGKEIEFDILATFKNCLVLIELKSMLTSYDLDDLETRRKHIADAKQQLLRRRESVQHDWNKICSKSSINLPEKPYDYEHIIMIACTDAYDYTPLYEDEIYITDLFHVMDFGPGEFDIRILNHRDLIVHNMQEFLLAGADYLRRSRSEEINARRV